MPKRRAVLLMDAESHVSAFLEDYRITAEFVSVADEIESYLYQS